MNDVQNILRKKQDVEVSPGVFEEKFAFKDNDYSRIKDVVIKEMKNRKMARSDIDAIEYIFSQKTVSVDFMKNTEQIE